MLLSEGSRTALRRAALTGLAVVVAGCCGCGSSTTKGSGGGGTGPSPDFTLQTSAQSLTLTAGGAAESLTVTVTAQNGFSSAVSVAVTGLPTGVTASPATLNVSAGSPQQVNFTAAGTATAQNVTVQLTGTAGTLTHTVQLGVTVSSQTKTTATGVDVTTYHDDVARTGLNPNETALTPQNVNCEAVRAHPHPARRRQGGW